MMLRGVHHLSRKISQSVVSSKLIITNGQRIAAQMTIQQCRGAGCITEIPLDGPSRILRENVRRRMAAEDKEPNYVQETKYPWNQKKVTVYHMLDKIDTLAKELLADENVWNAGQMNDLFQEETRHKYWLSVLEHSKLPLVVELKEKLKIAGISELDFSHSIAHVYKLLEKKDNFYLKGVSLEQKMMLAVLESLQLDKTQYESLKILYGLLKSPQWQI